MVWSTLLTCSLLVNANVLSPLHHRRLTRLPLLALRTARVKLQYIAILSRLTALGRGLTQPGRECEQTEQCQTNIAVHSNIHGNSMM